MKTTSLAPLAALALVVVSHSSIAAPADATIRYAIAPAMTGRALNALIVEAKFAGDADGETVFELPSEWAGSNELWTNLSDFAADGARDVRSDGKAQRTLVHAPGAMLTVRYRVNTAYAGDPGFDYQKAWPLIHAGWFFFHGEGVFGVPVGRGEAPVSFTWRGFPSEWKFASDLDHLAKLRPGTLRDISESVAIGAPDLVVVERDLGGAPLRIATRGAWGFAPLAFADMVEKIVATANRTWGGNPRPFLIPLAPIGGEGAGHSYHGTGRSDAFSIASTPNFDLDLAKPFLAHEYSHTWLPGELGDHLEQDQARGYWFSEGFTEYYAARVLLAAGLWSPAEYLANLNDALLRYGTSSARHATADDIVARFWTSGDVNKLPYDRGHLLAHVLDSRIREATKGRAGLHEVMQRQAAIARKNAAAGTRVPAATLFRAVLREVAGRDFMDELMVYADTGKPILLPADRFGACARFETVERAEFHRGFDIDATLAANRVITGTVIDGPAYAAGLRDGMTLVGRDGGVVGDSSVEIGYKVKDRGTERVFRYLPVGPGRVSFQRATLTGEPASTCTWY